MSTRDITLPCFSERAHRRHTARIGLKRVAYLSECWWEANTIPEKSPCTPATFWSPTRMGSRMHSILSRKSLVRPHLETLFDHRFHLTHRRSVKRTSTNGKHCW